MKKAVILATARCGSILLVQTLKQHPELKVCGEIFWNSLTRKNIPKDELYDSVLQFGDLDNLLASLKTPEYIDHVFEKFDVFKMLDVHVWDDMHVIDHLSSMDDLVVIRLKRRNVLHRLVSLRQAKHDSKWATRKRVDSTFTTPIKAKALIRSNAHLIELDNCWEKAFGDRLHHVYYEDLVYKWKPTIAHIERLLDVAPIPLEPVTVKIIQKPIPLVVENFDELAEEFKGTEFECMFERTYFSTDWFTHNIPLFQKQLQHYLDIPVKCLEIGSFEGRSATWIAENICKNEYSTLDCIEPGSSRCDNNKLLKQNITCSNLDSKITLHERMSKFVLPQLQRESYDFIYVDGSHSAADVLQDAVFSFELLKTGGIMAFDDYEWNDITVSDGTVPKSAIDAFVSIYEKKIEILHKGYQFWIKKIV